MLRIDSLAAGGDGVGRGKDGRVVFVPFTAPGDLVRVEIRSERARLARGRVAALLEPGAARTDPVCPVFGSCGGCAWQHVDYDAQVAAKLQILGDALERLGGVDLAGPITITPSPSPYQYRGRTRVAVVHGRVGYRKRRSHSLCRVRTCPILTPALDAELGLLAERAERCARGDLPDGEWEIAASDDSARAVALPAREGPRAYWNLGGDRLGVSPGVFSQSNALMLETLVAAVHTAVGEGTSACELYSGAGLFTLGLARRFDRVVAVESSPQAIADLGENLRGAGLSNVEARCQRVEGALSGEGLAGGCHDALLIDPPRSGLPPGAVQALTSGHPPPRRIVYLSCDAATLSRDLMLFSAAGFRVARVEAFDLFPQTPHVEALAVLEKE